MSSLFRKDPERYAPVNRGECPVSQVDGQVARPGDPRWGVLYQGRLFLCATQGARQRFLNDPKRYALVDVAEQGFCPHCLGGAGLLVRGDPKYTITREGRRYWFPDPSHRDAFLTANSTTVRR
jgi:YHS domain-containing protein